MDQIRPTRRSQAAPGERRRTSILDAAEGLFSREGPSAVTLRSIAAAADVNIAAVNYYFGSKEKLFEEMFLRRVVPLNEDRLKRLRACQENNERECSLRDIVTAYVMPAMQLIDAGNAHARAIVVQYSLGRVLAIPEVNEMLARYYARVREAFVAALQKALPHLAVNEVVWRYYWMGGSVMVALAVPSGTVEASDSARASEGRTVCRTVAANLIGFLVHGISAPGGTETAVRDSGIPVGGGGCAGGDAAMVLDLDRHEPASRTPQ